MKGGGLRVSFTEKNTAANATLNINSTGAKPLYYNGVRVSTNNSWYAGEIMTLFYDGSAFQINSLPDLDEYDVSARNGGQAFTFEEAVALVPEAYRHGGLKLRFIYNSDSSTHGSNKYVLYRYMGTETTGNPNPFLDEVNWQTIDLTRIFERKEVEMSISPNVLNRWGKLEALTIYSFHGAKEGYVNEYMLEFTVSGNDFTLTLPDGIRWIEEPTWEDGYTYQVSIINNLAVFAGWEVPEENE